MLACPAHGACDQAPNPHTATERRELEAGEALRAVEALRKIDWVGVTERLADLYVILDLYGFCPERCAPCAWRVGLISKSISPDGLDSTKPERIFFALSGPFGGIGALSQESTFRNCDRIDHACRQLS